MIPMSGSSKGAASTAALAGHQGNHSMAVNHRYSMPPHDGRNGGHPQFGPAPLPHIDDLLAAPHDLDANLSIKRLLEMAETSLRQADMSRDYKRPAKALRDFVRASIIVIQVVNAHKDFHSIKNQELGRQHAALLKKIDQQNDAYMQIKEYIRADNMKTGVQPTQARQKGINNVPSNQYPPVTSQDASRTKPAVHPKPTTMHGNAIKAGHGRASSLGSAAPDSLLSRFTTLSGPQSVPGQDPRIKTHALPDPRTMPPLPPPRGPRAMPPPLQKPRAGLPSPVPALPKMPDAIYSPARGSISGESTRAPPTTSTPRPSYSRTGSSTSLHSMAAAATPQQQQKQDYFAGAKDAGLPQSLPQKLAGASAITAEDLCELMKSKCSVLIIDVRPREDFAEGHIWSPATICIEPTVLDRGDLSAAELSESLVLASDVEDAAFKDRHKYDFVVFHDQDTPEMPEVALSEAHRTLARLERALVDFNYDTFKLKNAPKLLKGGLDAWTDLMGPAALFPTSSSATSSAIPIPRQPRRPSELRQRQFRDYRVKSLSRNEVEQWKAKVHQDDQQTASVPAYARSPEEFFRKFPPVLPEQESMTGSASSASSGLASYASPKFPLVTPEQNYMAGNISRGLTSYASPRVGLGPDLPTPPTRPAPAVPRPSYSGISQALSDDNTYDDTGAPQAQRPLARSGTGDSIAAPRPDKLTGLVNPHNWCYANSIIQALVASPGFGRELADSSWPELGRAPRKRDEKIDNPQLMIKIMSNLFHWMSTCKFETMQAQTLMEYCRHLRKSGDMPNATGNALFGSTQQQDASEFQTFLFQILDDETNLRRDVEIKRPDNTNKVLSFAEAADAYWPTFRAENLSVMDRYWRGHELQTTRCSACGTANYTFSSFNFLSLTLPTPSLPPMSLDAVFRRMFASDEPLGMYKCDNCKERGRCVQNHRLVSMPQLLCVSLGRAMQDEKLRQVVNLNLDDIDLSPYFQSTPGWAGQDSMYENSTRGPFRYECYAVVVHGGHTISSGHYYAYVRKTTTRQVPTWHLFNDTQVTKVANIDAAINALASDQTPFLLYFRRKS
jgi:ubiquitin carboxyl-terminal hydrolase 8